MPARLLYIPVHIRPEIRFSRNIPADLPPGSPERATGKSVGGAELKRCPGGAFAEGESEAEAW